MASREQTDLLELISNPPTASPTASRSPLGVPGDYVAVRQPSGPDPEAWRWARGEAGPAQPMYQPQAVAPRYFDGDQFRPAGLRPEDRAKFQRALIAAGLLDGRKTTLGVWDDTSSDAYGRLLAFANQSGLDELSALREWTAQFERFGETAAGSLPAVRLTNPADIAAITEKVAREVLGRRVDPADVERLTAQFHGMETGFAQAAHKQSVVGGTVTEPPSLATFLNAKLREIDPKGAQEMDTIGLANVFHSLFNEPASG